MATGDNALTAISVARECKMVEDSKSRIYLGEIISNKN